MTDWYEQEWLAYLRKLEVQRHEELHEKARLAWLMKNSQTGSQPLSQ